MGNQENNKSEPADYTNFLETKENGLEVAPKNKKKKRGLSFSALKGLWVETDKKTKIELIIFLIIIISIAVILIISFSSPKTEFIYPFLPAEY